jgi:cation:H+ antiporter
MTATSVAANVALAVVGLVILARAADWFVDGAVGLSRRFGVSAVLIGAVVIGLGTSLPELLVSVLAATRGDAALGIGTIVGSNTANLSLVLGVAAFITPLAVGASLLRREAPLSFVAVAGFGLALQGGLTTVDGVLLLLGLVVAIVIVVRTSTTEPDRELADDVDEAFVPERLRRVVTVTVVGLVGTTLGAQLLVEGASGLATDAGLSEGLVGVTLVAVGTSLPELVTAVHAARRGEDELIIGNVLGSNVFNSLLVGGLVALIAPGTIDDTNLVTLGAAAMVAVALAAWIVMARGRRVVRRDALVLLLGYGATVALVA